MREMLEDEDFDQCHRWGEGDSFSLLIPGESSASRRCLPLWGWCEASFRYRISYNPADEETLDSIAYDIFGDTDGQVLVVSTYRGPDSRGARGWPGPPHASEVPMHLVDSAKRRNVENWVFDGIAPVACRWDHFAGRDLTQHLDGASVVDSPSDMPSAVQKLADDEIDDVTWGWDSRGIDIDDTPRLVARFDRSDSRRGSDHWGLLFDADVDGRDFALVVTLRATPRDQFDTRCRVAYADEIARAAEEFGPRQGLVRLLARRVFDRATPGLQGSISF